MQRSSWAPIIVSALFLAQASPARAVITALTPLSAIVDKEEFIFIAKVKEILPDKPGLVLVFDENLKGKASFDRLPINLTGDTEAKKGKHTEVLLDRVDKDLPIIVVTTKRGGRYIAFGFTNGTWFQMAGRIENENGKEVVRWNFLHCEPYLRRTFKGTTAELKQIILDGVAKKKAPPAPNDKEEPGFGPPIKKASRIIPRRDGCLLAAIPPLEPTLAVIQLPFLGLIAALAALFPTLFGGLALFMKRWVALLSTSGLVSVFVAVPMLAPGWCGRQWIYSPAGLWLTSAALLAFGALWSLGRYRRALAGGSAEAMQPKKFDRLVVTLLFLAGAAAIGIGWRCEQPVWSEMYWRFGLAATLALGAGAWCLLAAYRRGESGPLRLAPESVMLWTLAGSCLALGSWEAGRYAQRDQMIVSGGGAGQPVLSAEPVWSFAPDCGGEVVSSLATPERLYVAVMIQEGLTGRHGSISALDPNTGAEIWHFDNDYDKDSEQGMKIAFSTPVLADGRLYFGEGMHEDKDSRLFCLDAATGAKLWDYRTESHTESTPAVADGKVVIGAGYHGIHCVDAVTGRPLWRYPPNVSAADQALHVDSNPAIADGRVYAGSGYKPAYVKEKDKINSILCLDLNTGREIWKERVEDSVYGSPLLHDGKVFFGTGNSTYSQTFSSKRPGIISRDAATGREVWDCILPENVMGRPAADKYQLYAGCLDGKAYAIDLRTGRINWKLDMGGPVLANPVVEVNKETGTADVVYFAGKFGAISAVAPYYGKIFWSAPLSHWTQKPVGDLCATPALLRFEDDNAVRHRLFIGFGQGDANATVPRLLTIEDTVSKK
jgi:outer membrane protein assembly factor BamB